MRKLTTRLFRRRARQTLPSGTLTFVLTDIEGSTRLWEQDAGAMERAVRRHLDIIERAVDREGGILVRERGEGDSTFSVFTEARPAVTAVLDAQRRLHSEPWPDGAPIQTRAAIHTGDARWLEGEYTATAINRCARIRALAHGGQTLVSGRTAAFVDELPAGAELRDLGAHRLRDLSRPERIYQLAHPDLPDDYPDLRSLDALPHNLPNQITSFVGRERELRELHNLIGANRLVCVVGPGGMGKTRLVLHAVADALDDFPDGVWFADLHAATTREHVEQAVAAALGIREQPGRPLSETLTEGTRGLQALVVLDNCEQVVDGASAVAAALVVAGPDVRIVATSREPLATSGAATFRLGPLPVPDTSDDPGALTESDAVRLFVDRASLARGTEVTVDASVARACQRLDGIPLAIELAAARASVLSSEEIASRLDDRLKLLTGGDPANVRHATLRATIDWSHELLDETERLAFRRLAVFSGGFTLEAAEAVAAGDDLRPDDVLDVLTRLVDRSLVHRDAEDEGVSRFAMLETVRAYALEALATSGALSEIRDRHLAAYVELAEAAEPALNGPDQVMWFERLDREHDNLRAALAYAREAERAEALARLSGALWYFWFAYGFWREGRAWLTAAMEIDTGVDPILRAKVLNGAGGLAQSQQDHVNARSHHEEALRLLQAAADEVGVADTKSYLAKLTIYSGDLATARRLAEESVATLRGADDPSRLVGAINILAEVLEQSREFGAARVLHEEALGMAQVAGDERQIARSYASLGMVAWAENDREAALGYLTEAVGGLRRVRDQALLTYALYYRGEILRQARALEDARAAFDEALALARRNGDLLILPSILRSTGALQASTAEDRGAARHLEEAVALLRAGDRELELGVALIELGELTATQGDGGRARALLEEARDIGRRLGDNEELVANADRILGTLHAPASDAGS